MINVYVLSSSYWISHITEIVWLCISVKNQERKVLNTVEMKRTLKFFAQAGNLGAHALTTRTKTQNKSSMTAARIILLYFILITRKTTIKIDNKQWARDIRAIIVEIPFPIPWQCEKNTTPEWCTRKWKTHITDNLQVINKSFSNSKSSFVDWSTFQMPEQDSKKSCSKHHAGDSSLACPVILVTNASSPTSYPNRWTN